MTTRRRSWFRGLRRTLHFTERTLGDVDAARRGVLHKRLARRVINRSIGRRTNRLFR